LPTLEPFAASQARAGFDVFGPEKGRVAFSQVLSTKVDSRAPRILERTESLTYVFGVDLRIGDRVRL
jgi:hypothetical protein